ncbi:hypothetical protein B0O80DRAFT_459870 [Mortierella sp. GBAus27b]|nr:hypothetical protein B0O80DRAFT_459870 [Mortierella sp. GBAus27b]
MVVRACGTLARATLNFVPWFTHTGPVFFSPALLIYSSYISFPFSRVCHMESGGLRLWWCCNCAHCVLFVCDGCVAVVCVCVCVCMCPA